MDLATSICFGFSAANTLMLLISASTTVTVYVEDTVKPSYLPGINSLFITCIGIIRNNCLVGGHTRVEVWTLATEHITLYCTLGLTVFTTWAGSWKVPWMLLLDFTYEKYSKARSTQKRYYTTRVVRHWYVIWTEEQQLNKISHLTDK